MLVNFILFGKYRHMPFFYYTLLKITSTEMILLIKHIDLRNFPFYKYFQKQFQCILSVLWKKIDKSNNQTFYKSNTSI